MDNTLSYINMDSPIGELSIFANHSHLKFVVNDTNLNLVPSFSKAVLSQEHQILLEAKAQLKEYFLGQRKLFKLPIDLSFGTSFQQKSWKTLLSIPYGKTIAYKKQAALSGDSKKARAIGSANGKNPILIIVPCHRVISSSGALGGFSAGLHNKKFLLDFESKNLI